MKRIAGKRKIIIFIAGISAVFFLAVFYSMIAGAVFDGDTEAIHIQPEEIENSTLIIGTHLIHISALTEELYDIAMETAKDSGQAELYYKSELAGGTWYMISDATELSDITLAEKSVQNSVISSLYIRYHTKSDGITYDLLDNTPVCIFDITDPYELSELAEMDALKTQLDSLNQKKNKSKTDVKNLSNIQKLIEKGSELKETNQKMDDMLASLNSLYEKHVKEPEADAIRKTMKQIDSSRRAAVLTELSDVLLPNLLNQVQLSEGEDTDGLYVDYDLTAAIGTALEEINSSLTEYESKALNKGSHALSEANYNFVQELAAAAEEGNEEEALALAGSIADISHIESGITVYPDRESRLITDKLLPLLDEKMKSCMDKESFQKVFSEGDFLAKSAVSKMSSEAAKEFLEQRISQINTMLEELKERVLEEGGGEPEKGMIDEELYALIQEMAEESKNVMRTAMTELSLPDTNEMSALLEKKKEYQTERLSALDENNLELAEQLAGELADLEEEIDALEKSLTEILNSDTAGEVEKSRAKAALQSGLAATQIESARGEILDDLEEGAYDSVLDALDGMNVLAQNSPMQALNALKDIYKNAAARLYLEDTGSANSQKLNHILNKVEEMTAEIAPFTSQDADSDTLMGIMEAVLGQELSQCSEKEQAAAAAALGQYAQETESSEAENLAAELAADLYSAGNSYLYLKLKNEIEEFISLDTFAACSSVYRYIYHDGNKTGILRRRTDFYEFTAFSSTVKLAEHKTDEMNISAGYQSSIYISSEYMKETFGASSQYISNTEYAVLILPDMENLIAEFLEALAQA